MGLFEDGYLEAVVRGHGSDFLQSSLNCDTLSMSCSSQRTFLAQAKSGACSLMAKSEDAASSALPEVRVLTADKGALTNNIKVEKTDLYDLLDSDLRHSSPAFAVDSAPDSPDSIYPSSAARVTVKREVATEVDGKFVLYGTHGGNHSCSPSNNRRTVLTPQQQLSGERIPTPVSAVAQSVSSSEVISRTTNTTTWPSPESQTNDPAKQSDFSLPPKESSSQSIETLDSSTSNQQGSKRSRKGQQKRVVFVPIAPGTGKSSVEVLPSDMWAWRKYGQKPIKGSPYPRGYYRCSSSKGCSARKQVERSRSDPSMLMITYTSEHNHAWPAHRNSLAGTTRTKSLDKLRSNNINRDCSAVASSAAPCSEEPGRTNAQAASMSSIISSCTETQPKQEIPSPSPLEQHSCVPSDENFKLVDEPHVILDNPCIIPMSLSQDQQLFQDLEALPELSAIIDENLFFYRLDEETGISNMAIDPFEIFCWSSSSSTSFLGNEIVG